MKRLISTLVTLALLAVSTVATARAATIDVSITPLTRDLSAKPGETITGTLDLTNLSNRSQTYVPLARNFTADPDSDGDRPKILPSDETEGPTDLADWIEFALPSVTIAPSATAAVAYRIVVPPDAEPGGHYGVVFATASSAGEPSGSGVTLSGSVGSLILLTVSGDVTVDGSARQLVAVDSGGTPRRIFEAPPIHLKLTLRNDGNVHLIPTGTLTVTRGSTTVLTQALNQTGGRLLPSSDRTYRETIADDIGYGRFTAAAALTLTAPTGQTIPASLVTSFWILPIRAIAVSLAALLLALVVFRLWMARHDAAVRATIKRRRS